MWADAVMLWLSSEDPMTKELNFGRKCQGGMMEAEMLQV
jgi:hypothetical protein